MRKQKEEVSNSESYLAIYEADTPHKNKNKES
jgi:hypothetical protein